LTDTKHYDLIVFGGGNAISTAIQCGAKGMQVALVEKGPLGPHLSAWGCIPSKLLIDEPLTMARYRTPSSPRLRSPVSVH
jgi:dihydrolipoamide dehydrogenase